jgi:signal transduction histidine kinase
MDDATLAKLVNRSARAMLALRHDEERRDFLARLHDGVVADLRARRLDRDLATVRADMVVEAVLDATARGVRRLETAIDRLETNAGIGQGVTGIRPG